MLVKQMFLFKYGQIKLSKVHTNINQNIPWKYPEKSLYKKSNQNVKKSIHFKRHCEWHFIQMIIYVMMRYCWLSIIC